MDPATWRYMLIIDWATIENTPREDRHPLKIERWQARVDRLAAVQDRSSDELRVEIQAEGENLARRQRNDQLAELARDMAVSRVLGTGLKPPWQHRLSRLVQLTGRPPQEIREQVENLASTVQVSVLS